MRSVDFRRGGLGFAVNFMLFFACLVLFFGFIGSVEAQTPVSGCTTISSSGVYVLTKDITSGSTCIIIESSDVVFDGQGYSITGPGSYSNYYGIYVYKSGTTLTNVTVRKVTVMGWGLSGIYYRSVANGRIVNNTANSNDQFGIRLEFSSNNTITNNTANSNTYRGIYLDDSSNNTITGNTMSANTYNFGVWGGSTSDFVQTIDTSVVTILFLYIMSG